MRSPRTIRRVCLTPQVSGVGGMVSFQAKLKAGLAAREIQVTHDPADEGIDAALVVGGTRQLVALRRMRRRGVPVVQRLDGMNWLHRRLRTGARHWLRAEFGNWLLAYIRERIATGMVYQSQFVVDWWRRVHGAGPAASRVIYNGVDLRTFSPGGNRANADDQIRILMVEGNLQGGYEVGLKTAVALVGKLRGAGNQVELVVAGQVEERLKSYWSRQAGFEIEWAGVVPNEQLPEIYRRASLLFSGDLNAACPNSVIEAMACGLPVLAFDTGALKELVPPNAGRVVPYGGDPWKLEPPDVAALAEAAAEVLSSLAEFKAGARAQAEAAFDLERMTDAYLEALSG